MNEKFNKALLDHVVKTANELGKHHANQVLELVSGDVDSRFDAYAKNVDNVVDLVSDIDKNLSDTQDKFKLEIEELVGKINTAKENLSHAINNDSAASNGNFTKLYDEIETLKAALGELSDLVDSNENINALADAVNEMEKKFSVASECSDGLVESFVLDVTKVNESLAGIKNDISGNDEAQANRVEKVRVQIEESVATITNDLELHENNYVKRMDTALNDIAKFYEQVDVLKTSLVGYGNDLTVVSKDLHKKFDELSKNDDEFNESLIAIHNLIKATESNGSKLRGEFDACTKILADQIAELTASAISEDAVESKVAEIRATFADALNKSSDDFVALVETNTKMLADVETISAALSEQFSELKQESFLSNDKIDTKFAEIRLSLVETDIRRNEALKEIVNKHATDIQKDLDESFKEYRRNIGNQVETSNKLVVDNVDKMLSTDKQLLARAKQWESGVEYGASVIVRNIGGVWQSRSSTYDEPTVKSDEWYCLASSFHKTSVIEQHNNGVETVIGFHDSLDNVHEVRIPVPGVRYLKGVFDPAVAYDKLDSIMKDGCRWVATKDEPSGVPGEDTADWQVLTMRGPKGMKGGTGERGPQGKTGPAGEKGHQGDPGPVHAMNDIVKALVDFERGDSGQAIRRARGHWKLGESYQAGDVATVGRGLFLALRNNEGIQTPGASTEDWLLLVEASAGGTVQPGAFEKLYLTDAPLLVPPVDGVIEYNDGHLYFTDGDRFALVGSNGVKVDTSTIANSVVETTIYSHLFPANAMHADMRITASSAGSFSAASASETLTINFKLGGTSVHTVVITPSNGVDIGWKAVHDGTIRVAGVSGTYIDSSEFSESGVASIYTAEVLPHDVDTTQDVLYEITVTWGLAKAGNSFTCTQGDLTYKH